MNFRQNPSVLLPGTQGCLYQLTNLATEKTPGKLTLPWETSMFSCHYYQNGGFSTAFRNVYICFVDVTVKIHCLGVTTTYIISMVFIIIIIAVVVIIIITTIEIRFLSPPLSLQNPLETALLERFYIFYLLRFISSPIMIDQAPSSNTFNKLKKP